MNESLKLCGSYFSLERIDGKSGGNINFYKPIPLCDKNFLENENSLIFNEKLANVNSGIIRIKKLPDVPFMEISIGYFFESKYGNEFKDLITFRS